MVGWEGGEREREYWREEEIRGRESIEGKVRQSEGKEMEGKRRTNMEEEVFSTKTGGNRQKKNEVTFLHTLIYSTDFHCW